MGDVFTSQEIQELDENKRTVLKQHVMHHLQISEEIRRIISTDPGLLQTLLRDHPEVRDILRARARPLLDALK